MERTTRGSRPVIGYLVAPDRDGEEAIGRIDSHLHGDSESICPRCLRWIEERDFVRQTAYGPMQHEVCPP